ncbi:MAG: hypothetical protein JST68_29435 [Bacteroidetes bacterium]|nr:hypothetical protein [Bacteroidota bacterium]
MKKLILPAMIALLSLSARTAEAQVKVDFHVGVPLRPMVAARPAPVIVVRPLPRPVIVVRPRPVAIVRPAVVVRPAPIAIRPARHVVIY